MSSSYQSLLGLSELQTESISSDNITTTTLVVNKDCSILGNFILPTGAVNNYFLMSDASGYASWKDPTSSIILSGDATGAINSNVINTLANGTINVSNLVLLAGVQTLTNKTLTLPIISSISNGGTITIPTGTNTLATLSGSETLTNKTITSSPIVYLTNAIQIKTLCIYDNGSNSNRSAHNFSGFGISNSTFRIHCGDTGSDFVFYAPTSTTTSNEVFRIKGTGPISTSSSLSCSSLITSTIINTGTLTLPTSTDVLIGRNTTYTLTNKTLTSPIINSLTTFSNNIYMNNQIQNKMIALNDYGTTTDQTLYNYMGFGVSSSVLRYQVPATCSHSFYVSNTSSSAIMSIYSFQISMTAPLSASSITTGTFQLGASSTAGYVLTASSLGAGTWQAPAVGNLTGDITSVGLVTTASASIVKTTAIQTLTNKTLGYTVFTNNFFMNNNYQPKMIALYDNGTPTNQSQHNYNGFGMTAGILRYQVDVTDDHVFYAATSNTTSNELFRLKNAGGAVMVGRLEINTGPTGNYNMSISNNGLSALTTGLNNIIIGNNCGSALTTGSGSVAIGKDCFTIATTATGCVAIGRLSMANANGNADTGCGVNTLGYSTVGYNTAIGSSALSSLSTGTNCVGVGVTAGYSSQFSSNNTFIGCFSDISADTWSNSSCLGYQSVITASNQVTLGNPSTTDVVTTGALTFGGGSRMSIYEEYVHITTFNGPTTTSNTRCIITQIGKQVTLYVGSGVSGNTSTGSQVYLNMTTSIPSRFQIVGGGGITCLVGGFNNGSTTASIFRVYLDSSLKILILGATPIYYAGQFNIQPFSLTWSLV